MWSQIKLEFNMQTVKPATVLQIAVGKNSMIYKQVHKYLQLMNASPGHLDLSTVAC